MQQAHYNVLFLCTANSARSIMAEAILNHRGKGRFSGFSAGSNPVESVRPEALKQIEIAKIPTAGLKSKSWFDFSKVDSPVMNFIFNVSDELTPQEWPVWPGHPMIAHWAIPDPVAAQGTPEEINHAYWDAFLTLDRRIGLFISLPISSLNQMSLKTEIEKIAKA